MPRSASLALWLWAVSSTEEAAAAARTVVDDDEPHQLAGDVPPGLDTPTVGDQRT